jgi:hypothetical protein
LYLGDGLLVFCQGFGDALDLRDFFFYGRFLVILFVFFFLEILAAPGILAQRGLVHGARINDYAGFDGGLEIDAAEVRGGGLQSVEKQAGGFGVQLSVEDEAHDLHERDLDGVGVL